MNDDRFTVRRLKNPGFTAVSVLTLARSVGANTAVFTFIKTPVCNPVSARDTRRLVSLFSRDVSALHGGIER
jgi:hypothetical protein